MKRSEIYREAAQIVAHGECSRSCYAINRVQRLYSSDRNAVQQAYVDTMLDGEYATWALDWGGDGDSQKAHDIRVLALCFMAAIAEAEEAATKVNRAKKKRRSLAHAKRVPAVSK